MPAHQATAMTALLPIGVPVSSPRTVSMTGVNGWYSANQRSPTGIGPEPDQQRDAGDDRQGEHRLDHAAEDVAGQHRGTEDRHGAEAGDDPLGHVHGDR